MTKAFDKIAAGLREALAYVRDDHFPDAGKMVGKAPIKHPGDIGCDFIGAFEAGFMRGK